MTRILKVSRLEHIPGIGVDKMGDAADALHDNEVLRLENLDTDSRPPEVAIEVTKASIDVDEQNSYLPFFGQNELRKACCKRVSSVAGVEYDWEKECIITAGGMSGILNCLLATLEPGDEVVVTDPVYAGVLNRIYLAGGKPVFVPLIATNSGWRMDLDVLDQKVSKKTRIILMSPAMPSGHVLTKTEWEKVAEAACRVDAWLLYDAAMERILYDNLEVIHPVSFDGMYERTITVGAASKELRMIGWRIGWVVAPKEIMEAIRLVSISNVVCQTGISMKGAAAALNERDDGLSEVLGIWRERRDLLLQELQGLPVVTPQGGWSMLLNAKACNMTSTEMTKKLFTEAKIAATPMVGWGERAADYVRFVFSNEPKERLQGIGDKIRRIL